MLTGVERWPEWQAGVSSVGMNGELRAGTVFRWKAKGLDITSTLQEFEPPRCIGWTGRSLGTKAVHLWRLEPEDDGTRVTTGESMSGWLPRILKAVDPGFLDKSLRGSLQALKEEAERP